MIENLKNRIFNIPNEDRSSLFRAFFFFYFLTRNFLGPTVDILKALDKARKVDQLIIGFAAETKNLLENASKKLESKNLDLIVANDVSAPGVGFGHDTNSVSVIDRNGASTEISLCDKKEIARNIIDIVTESWSIHGTDPKIQ